MSRRKLSILTGCVVVAAALVICMEGVPAQDQQATDGELRAKANTYGPANRRRITRADREAAAGRSLAAPHAPPGPGDTPDYFGVCPNYANSQLPYVDPKNKNIIIGGIRKFVDSLPGLGAGNANNLGQYIPVANADTITYSGSDYYEIALVEYSERMHSDLPATRLRGYVQTNYGTDPQTHLNTVAPSSVHYMGPLIIARKNRPVRIKFTNMLPTGSGGDLFIPTDTTVMGAGMGPDEATSYTQNRAAIHLHGGATPWISDGTPHQWITPSGEATAYTKGDSARNVPDMPDPGSGSQTYYYSNQQSSRLMFYHDHSWGITRLNVYVGEAAGYLVTDDAEERLINSGALPGNGMGVYRYGIPLVIQDKTFVPPNDATVVFPLGQLTTQDPTWDTAKWGGTGSLWFPHVYMPNQNPEDSSGASAMGRWDYGPWFWPPFNAAAGLVNGPVANPYFGQPGEPEFIPGTPNPSVVPESFMDTPVVNGTAYPYLNVEPRRYRFRILNACNDRFLNLQLYMGGGKGYYKGKEITMVAAVPNTKLPDTWPTDAREGGAPSPKSIGPTMVQVGTEGGFLPQPVELLNQPIDYVYNRRDIVVLNVSSHTLFLGPAERADVVVDFSGVKPGSSVILYNDSPAPVPGFDPRLDYYTGNPDLTSTGGAPSTLPGYGPNTRTIMQFRVVKPSGNLPPETDNHATTMDKLRDTGSGLPHEFAASSDLPIVPERAYGDATDTYARIQDTSITFTPRGSDTPVTVNMQPKSIIESFETDYGRMNAMLGVEMPFTNNQNQTSIWLQYVAPPTETLTNGQYQIWKVTHNGVDTHAIHFHLFNVQLINRVGWDGAIRPPDDNEVGWKETVRMNPLEDAIVALRPILPTVPFSMSDSVRLLNPAMPSGSVFQSIDPVTNQMVNVTNELTNFGHEYVWHCHLLGHEENDMMRPMPVDSTIATPSSPTDLSASVLGATQAALAWTDMSGNETGFRIERSLGNSLLFATVDTVGAGVTTYTDTTAAAGAVNNYRVVAFNGSGDSMPSHWASVLTAAPAAPYRLSAIPSAKGATPAVTLLWNENSNNEAGFTVQRAGDAKFTKDIVDFSAAAHTATYADSTVAAKGKYYYRVKATNVIGDSAWSNIATATVP